MFLRKLTPRIAPLVSHPDDKVFFLIRDKNKFQFLYLHLVDIDRVYYFLKIVRKFSDIYVHLRKNLTFCIVT